MDHFNFYTFLLRNLSGKYRCPYSRHVFNLVDQTYIKINGQILNKEDFKKNPLPQCNTMLQELLVSLILLVDLLTRDAIDSQATFDILMNLLVIFSKIIKQNPDLYFELND